jgi:hypothetical protein
MGRRNAANRDTASRARTTAWVLGWPGCLPLASSTPYLLGSRGEDHPAMMVRINLPIEVPRSKVEAESGPRQDANPPSVQVIVRLHQVLGAGSPAPRLRDPKGVNFTCLSPRHDLLALGAIIPGPAWRFLENRDNPGPRRLARLGLECRKRNVELVRDQQRAWIVGDAD